MTQSKKHYFFSDSVTTTDGITFTPFSDAALTLETDKTYGYRAKSLLRTSPDGYSKFYVLEGTYKNIDGVVTNSGAAELNSDEIFNFSDAGLNGPLVRVHFNIASQTITPRALGVAATTINWSLWIEWFEL